MRDTVLCVRQRQFSKFHSRIFRMNTSIDQALQPISDLKIDDGDHEKFSHYVKKDQIVESAVTGKPVIALCGKVWVPNRDPQKFPICPQCQEIYNKLKPA